MATISHETPVILLRNAPGVAAALLPFAGISPSSVATSALTSNDLSYFVDADHKQRHADVVVLVADTAGLRVAVVVEVQRGDDGDKEFRWPCYLGQARDNNRCAAVLIVVCSTFAAAQRCRAAIRTGHPDYDLIPVVIYGRDSPDPEDPRHRHLKVELTVLAAHTGFYNLRKEAARRKVLTVLREADMETDRLKTYTRLVLSAASPAARKKLEQLMTVEYRGDIFDVVETKAAAKGVEEGIHLGQAKSLLTVLAARGIAITERMRQRIQSSSDVSELDGWLYKAVTADSAEAVFGV